jgi:hypothetical protein
VPDIFDEVDADLRAERTHRLLARYGKWIAAVAVVFVAGAAAGSFVLRGNGWTLFGPTTSTAVSDRFLAAMRIADGPAAGRAGAIPGFASVADDSAPGYRTLARLREAALKADTGDLAGASALWDQVAGDDRADPVMRDLADLQWALHHIDSSDSAPVAARLDRLVAAPGGAWRAMAEEAQAALAMRQGHKDAARDILKRLTQDTTAPDGVRGRANGLLARLGG